MVGAGAPRPIGQDLAEAEGVGEVPARRQIHTGTYSHLIQIYTENFPSEIFQGKLNLCLALLTSLSNSLLHHSLHLQLFTARSMSKVDVAGERDH